MYCLPLRLARGRRFDSSERVAKESSSGSSVRKGRGRVIRRALVKDWKYFGGTNGGTELSEGCVCIYVHVRMCVMQKKKLIMIHNFGVWMTQALHYR